MSMPRHVVERTDILRDFEIKRMIDEAPELWLQALICLAWIFGKRITELLTLERNNVEVKEGYLYARFHVLKKRKLDEVYTKKITLQNKYVPPILSYLDTVKEGKLFQVTRQLALYYLKKVNPNSYWHYFRHSLATEMAERGATEYKLMTWFDWDTPAVAYGYVKKGTKLTEEYSNRTW